MPHNLAGFNPSDADRDIPDYGAPGLPYGGPEPAAPEPTEPQLIYVDLYVLNTAFDGPNPIIDPEDGLIRQKLIRFVDWASVEAYCLVDDSISPDDVICIRHTATLITEHGITRLEPQPWDDNLDPEGAFGHYLWREDGQAVWISNALHRE